VAGDQAEKRKQQGDADEVERQAQPARQQQIQRIDADVRAVKQRRAERPRGTDGERVAGELVGAADGGVEELAQRDVDADQQRGGKYQAAAEPQAEPRQPVRELQLTGALRPSVLPTVLFHSAAHSAPQRLAQPASTAPSTSFLCISASAGLTGTMVRLASLPMVQGCFPVLQLSASAVAFPTVVHILFS
jgi:hypothetical protein